MARGQHSADRRRTCRRSAGALAILLGACTSAAHPIDEPSASSGATMESPTSSTAAPRVGSSSATEVIHGASAGMDRGDDPHGGGSGNAALATFAPPAPAKTALPTGPTLGACPKRRDKRVGLIVSPKRARPGAKVRVLAAELDAEGPLVVQVDPEGGDSLPLSGHGRPGTPVASIAEFVPDKAGTYVVKVGRDGQTLACGRIAINDGVRSGVPPPVDPEVPWRIERSWGAAEEALYSAWVRELFWAPPGEDLAWQRLDQVTRDRSRNVLWNHLGWGEDADSDRTPSLVPDCADTPYFLRAYFAWKRGLPFMFRRCSRGVSGAPRCFDPTGVADPPDLRPEWLEPETKADQLMVVGRFFRRTIAWGVHSGNGRTAYGDDQSDFYPVRLDRRGLRPGVIYADPYGHLLVVVELVPQADRAPGVLYAIDGQPDGSITRKRFWEGNFLWNPDPALGGAGFKAFRPVIVVEREEGGIRLETLGDRAIQKREDYADADPAQGSLDAPAFYDAVERVISPQPIDARAALRAAVDALSEQARVRVTSIENGRLWARQNPGRIASMPSGHAVFETSGPWEDYSTPSRDLRLLIAIDVVKGFEAKVRRNPAAFGLTSPAEIEATLSDLVGLRAQWLGDPALGITYVGSDDAKVSLTLEALIDRAIALEMAYNPNDCPEVRWGAPEKSEEEARCNRRAPDEQRAAMERYRLWFAERRRPPRNEVDPEAVQ